MDALKQLLISIFIVITFIITPKTLFGMRSQDKRQKTLNYLLLDCMTTESNESIILRIQQGATCDPLALLRYAKSQHDKGHSKLIDFLADTDEYPFKLALEERDVAIAQCLLHRYPDLNKPILLSHHGIRALQSAILHNDAEFCLFLLQEGVSALSDRLYDDKDEKNPDYMTLAHYAAFLGRAHIVKIIVNHLKSKSIKPITILDRYECGLLHYTWHPNKPEQNHASAIEITRFLVEQGCTNHLSSKTITPALLAGHHYTDPRDPNFQMVMSMLIPRAASPYSPTWNSYGSDHGYTC